MKKIFISTHLLLLVSITTLAQFQQVQKKQTTTPKTQPTVVNNPVLVAKVLHPSGNFTDPSNTFTLPDGRKVTMTLRQKPQNLPGNFGGVVNETVAASDRKDMGDKICNTEVKSINAQSSTFMNVNYNQQAIHIFPGAIYTYTNFFSGNFRALKQGRNLLKIPTDNLPNSTGATFWKVQTPTSENIKAKMRTLSGHSLPAQAVPVSSTGSLHRKMMPTFL